jgi:hypothetical protein
VSGFPGLQLSAVNRRRRGGTNTDEARGRSRVSAPQPGRVDGRPTRRLRRCSFGSRARASELRATGACWPPSAVFGLPMPRPRPPGRRGPWAFLWSIACWGLAVRVERRLAGIEGRKENSTITSLNQRAGPSKPLVSTVRCWDQPDTRLQIYTADTQQLAANCHSMSRRSIRELEDEHSPFGHS